MGMTVADIRTLTRVLIAEATASLWSDASLLTFINEGSDDFCTQTGILQDISTQAIAAYKADYDIPSDVVNIKKVEIMKGNNIYELEPLDTYESFEGKTKTTRNPPEGYTLWGDKIRLSDRPSSAQSGTTLSGATSAAATTISITTATGILPRHGRVRLASQENVEFWHHSGTNMLVCSRGIEDDGTRSATNSNHADAGTVKLQDLWIYHTKTDKALSADTDEPNIPNQFRPGIAYYAAAVARLKSKDLQEAAALKQVYQEYLMKGLDYIKGRWKHKVNTSK